MLNTTNLVTKYSWGWDSLEPCKEEGNEGSRKGDRFSPSVSFWWIDLVDPSQKENYEKRLLYPKESYNPFDLGPPLTLCLRFLNNRLMTSRKFLNLPIEWLVYFPY